MRPAASDLVSRRADSGIHIGAIPGLPGKIAALLASLVVASLPITGFSILWEKRKRREAGL